ncbi:MAG: hypothetical protein SNH57_01960 [Rikenellaceae bacterium]
MRVRLFAILLLILPVTLTASEDESASLSDLDPTLFNLYTPKSDPYSEATKYYRPQISQRRRGIDWWIADGIIDPIAPIIEGYEVDDPTRRVRLFGSTRGYSIGCAGEFSSSFKSGWSISADMDLRTGRDANIEGVFRQDLRFNIRCSRQFKEGHYIDISLNTPLLTRGLQSSTSQETTTLTGNNLYNPSWGLYDGKVRNSRVSKYSITELSTHYQHPLNRSTTLVTTLLSKIGRRSISRLGWYDAYNPTPNYYRKLPSYISDSDTKAEVEQVWRDNDTSYTQIAWDNLVSYNQRSSDGSAHYILEEQVELTKEVEFTPTLVSKIDNKLEINYGLKLAYNSNRHFKELDDLLGAEYHLDHDLYIGDYVHLGNDMQNDLRNPDRKVVEGERFGYDYTSQQSLWALYLGFNYRSNNLSIAFRGEFGENSMSRIGHYEKERFPGTLSYGQSSVVKISHNIADLRVSYSLNGRHHLSLRGAFSQIPIDDSDLFIQIQNANRTIDNPTPREISNLNLSYRYERGDLSLDIEGYLLYSRKETQVWSYYDDITYTYSNIVTQGIGTRSIGLDIVGRYKVSRELSLDIAIALGDYTYDTTPTVTLYDDSTMEQLSTSDATAIEGCKLGNAPQLLITTSLNYLLNYSWILSLNCSYGGGRYVTPSFARRTDKVLLTASYAPELAAAIVEQDSMPSVFDATVSVVKLFYLPADRRLSLNFRINNLLGDRDRIEYGGESPRVLTTSAGSSVGSQYLQPNSYTYGTPRTLYLSCSLLF